MSRFAERFLSSSDRVASALACPRRQNFSVMVSIAPSARREHSSSTKLMLNGLHLLAEAAEPMANCQSSLRQTKWLQKQRQARLRQGQIAHFSHLPNQKRRETISAPRSTKAQSTEKPR
jgi:hypothetical protein